MYICIYIPTFKFVAHVSIFVNIIYFNFEEIL